MDANHVVRGEFAYQGALFVDVGGPLRRHPRASQHDLRALLDGTAQRDQVAHFYEAQLIHYGLQRSRDKNTAKVRLQQALNQNGLNVPAHIADMEAQMKKEFAASVRMARVASGTGAAGAADGTEGAGRKRKQSDEVSADAPATNKKTKITMKIGDVEVSIDHDAAEALGCSGAKRATATPSKIKAASKAAAAAVDKSPRTPQSKKATQSDAKTATPSRSKSSQSSATLTRRELAAQDQSPSRAAPQASNVKAWPKIKAEPKAKNEPKVKSEVKSEPADPEPKIRHITGVYNVSCPELEAQYPEEANNLRVFLCVDNDAGKIWGGFELAAKSGVLLINDDFNVPNPRVTLVGDLAMRPMADCLSAEVASERSSSMVISSSERLCTTCSRSRSSLLVRGVRDLSGVERMRGSLRRSGMGSWRRRMGVEPPQNFSAMLNVQCGIQLHERPLFCGGSSSQDNGRFVKTQMGLEATQDTAY